jgi:hypothetical protein
MESKDDKGCIKNCSFKTDSQFRLLNIDGEGLPQSRGEQTEVAFRQCWNTFMIRESVGETRIYNWEI